MEFKGSCDGCGVLGILTFFGAGVQALRLGVKSLREQLRRRATWRHATATVTLVYPIGREKRRRFARKLRFDSPTGPADFTTVAQTSFLQVGQEVPVRYDPEQPTNAMIDSMYHWVIEPLLSFFFATVLIGGSVLAALR